MTPEVMGHHESDVLLCMEKDMERKKDILTDHRFLYMTEFLVPVYDGILTKTFKRRPAGTAGHVQA